MRRSRRLRWVMAYVLLAASVSGCGLFGLGEAEGLDRALELVSEDASQVEFVDMVRVHERLDVKVPEDPSDKELAEYRKALVDSNVDGTQIHSYLGPMVEAGTEFSALDIEWEALARGEDLDGLVIWRLDDDLDFDALADDLKDAGWDRRELAGYPRLTVDPSIGNEVGLADGYPVAVLSDIVLLADEQLIVRSAEPDQAVEVIDGEAESLADAGTFDEVLDDRSESQLALLETGDQVCGQAGERPAPPALIEEWKRAGLGNPQARGSFLLGDEPEAVTVLDFDDEDEAKADASARETFLGETDSPVTGRPWTELADWEIDVDGPLEVISIDFEEGPDFLPRANDDGENLGLC